MAQQARRARIEDVHELAMNMPHVSVIYGGHGNPVYQVGGKSFHLLPQPAPGRHRPGYRRAREARLYLDTAWTVYTEGQPAVRSRQRGT